MSKTDLTTLHRATEAARVAQAELRVEVLAARDKGASWAEIGEAIGTTKQAAQQRYAARVRVAQESRKIFEARELEGQESIKVDAAPATKAPAKKASRKVATKAPAITPATDHRPPHYIDGAPQQALLGTGKGKVACPRCGSSNHKGSGYDFANFYPDCTPTKHDPQHITDYMNGITA